MTGRVVALVLVVLACAAAAVVAVPLAGEVVAGRGKPVLGDVPGPGTGPGVPRRRAVRRRGTRRAAPGRADRVA